jgi:UDP-3-O-[3-hydroxymyristoyl] glucosamine N-acyltransferase
VDAPTVEDAATRRGEDLLMMTFEEITTLVGAEAATRQGEFARVSNLEDASADAVVFATDAKTFEAALRSRGGAILASAKAMGSGLMEDPRVIRVGDARYAFALVAACFRRETERGGVHPTAVIGAGASLGIGTSVGPHSSIGDGVLVGDGCRVEANVTIYPGTTLGNRVVVQAGTVLGSTGFGYARSPETGEYLLFPQQGTLVIEDDVEIGANTTIDRGALGETRIGRGTKIDNLVHIGHNCTIGQQVIIAAQTGISGSSVVEDGAILGGQVGIGEHATVGQGVILGGGAGVLSGKKMQGSGQVFWGRPARPLKEYLRDLARLSGGRVPKKPEA